MSTAELKSNLISLINRINDNSKLQAIYTLLSSTDNVDEVDWWNELSTAEKASIEKGLEDYKDGTVFTSEQVKSDMAKKYPQLRVGTRQETRTSALHAYDSTIAYLLENWTVKDAQNFIDSVNEMEEQLKKFPNSFPISDKKQYLRKAVIGKHNSIVYQIDGDAIVFVTFLGNKQDHEYQNTASTR